MLGYALLTYLWLLANNAEGFTVERDYGLRVIDFLEPLPARYLIAPQLRDNGYGVVNYEETKEQPGGLHIELRVFDVETNDFKECFLDLKARSKAKKSGVSRLIKLNDKNVVFSWYDETSHSNDRLTRVVAVDLKDCMPIDLNLNHLSNKVVVLPRTYSSFDVIVSDDIICRDVGRQCRISYDLKLRSFDVNRFVVNLDWSKFHIKYLRDETFLVHGFEEQYYKVMMVDSWTGRTKELLSLFKAEPRLEFVSSDLSFCWIGNPGVDVEVQCSQFNRHGKLIFSRTIVFDEAVTLVNVHSVRDNEIFIITGKADCENRLDCWNLMSTEVNRDQNIIEHRSLHFHCTGSRKRLAMSYTTDKQRKNSVIVQYACRHGNGYAYDRISIGTLEEDDLRL